MSDVNDNVQRTETESRIVEVIQHRDEGGNESTQTLIAQVYTGEGK